jgi:hypothetical protein
MPHIAWDGACERRIPLGDTIEMSFVGDPFDLDIFVSYSHGDIQGNGQSPLKQWSQSFVRELQIELQVEINAATKLFLDENPRPGQGVDRMAPLSGDLKDKISGAAILTVLMTPQYLGSYWCRQERDWWIESQRRHGIPHENRIAVARVLPTVHTDWPPVLTDGAGNRYVGVHFFDRSLETGARPYGWPQVNGATGGLFRDAVVTFAGLIQTRLREIRKELELRRQREEEVARLRAGSGQAIYLHGRESQQEAWERARRELVESGYGVFPFQPEPVDSEPKKMRERARKRMDRMQTCDAILLLGTEDSEALEGDLSTIGHLDRHLAIANSNRLLPCGVADTIGILGRDPMLKRIASNLRVDWIDASVSPWAPQVQAWLNGAVR